MNQALHFQLLREAMTDFVSAGVVVSSRGCGSAFWRASGVVPISCMRTLSYTALKTVRQGSDTGPTGTLNTPDSWGEGVKATTTICTTTE